MSGSSSDLDKRLMRAMRSLSALEREVRSFQAVARVHSGAGPPGNDSSADGPQSEISVSADLKLVLDRRKELGSLWGSDLEVMQRELDSVELERLLTPLKLKSVGARPAGRKAEDRYLSRIGSRPLQRIARDDPVGDERTNGTWKRKRLRQRQFSGFEYNPSHITRMFHPKDAVARVMRSKGALRVDDVDDDRDEEEEMSEEDCQKALSIASTGSNIVVYRAPSHSGVDAPGMLAEPSSLHQVAPIERPVPDRKQRSLSTFSVPSRETLDLDRLQEVDVMSDTSENIISSALKNARRSPKSTPLLAPLKEYGRVSQVNQTPDEMTKAQTSTFAKPFHNQIHTTTGSSDMSFATSNGTSLFVSDKKRPRKSAVAIAEGTVLGNHASRIDFPTPLPATEERFTAELTPQGQTKEKEGTFTSFNGSTSQTYYDSQAQ